MAEKAAHHTTTVVSRPSIFEVIAQENLSSTGYPALKKIANYIALKNPELLKWLVQYFDEVFLVLNTVCQYQYLKKYGGTFSENFYDLTRVSYINKTKPTNNQLYINLMLVVCVPYLRNKFNVYIDQLERKHTLHFKEKKLIVFKKIFHTCWEALCLIYYVRYINGSSQAHSPLMDMAGMILTYKNVEPPTNEPLTQLSIKEYIVNYLKYGLSHSLELGAFFMQFLNWWQSENLQSKLIAYPIPNPPEVPDKYKQLKNTNTCPICLNKRKMPTALTVSGFVFCYNCLNRSLMRESRCPVTKLPATTQDMVYIYLNV